MKKQLFYLFALLVLISCSENPTDSDENGKKTGTIRDVEGNVYQIVKIGKQWWMAENLKVNKYRNGEWIINVTGSASWSNLSIGAYCYPDNNFNNEKTYGNLYNWYAVQDFRNIAPDGWHVPTDDDWQKLADYLGGNSIAGEKMKSTGTIEGGDGLWLGSNDEATNESGFSALPAGYRNSDGSFDGVGNSPYFWSSTESADITAWYRYLDSASTNIYSIDSGLKQAGYSIRCVRD